MTAQIHDWHADFPERESHVVGGSFNNANWHRISHYAGPLMFELSVSQTTYLYRGPLAPTSLSGVVLVPSDSVIRGETTVNDRGTWLRRRGTSGTVSFGFRYWTRYAFDLPTLRARQATPGVRAQIPVFISDVELALRLGYTDVEVIEVGPGETDDNTWTVRTTHVEDLTDETRAAGQFNVFANLNQDLWYRFVGSGRFTVPTTSWTFLLAVR